MSRVTGLTVVRCAMVYGRDVQLLFNLYFCTVFEDWRQQCSHTGVSSLFPWTEVSWRSYSQVSFGTIHLSLLIMLHFMPQYMKDLKKLPFLLFV